MSLKIADPAAGAPEVMPLFAGMMTFLADPPTAPLKLPAPSDIVAWSQGEYDSWQTVGTLMVKVDAARQKQLETSLATAEVIPRVAWYWPIHITKDFLFESIKEKKLLPAKVKKTAGGVVETSDAQWAAYAVSGFLNGIHIAQIRMDDADPTKDDAYQFHMPTWDMDSAGEVNGWLAIAAGTILEDGQDGPVVSLAGTTSTIDPRHPQNALLHPRKTLTIFRDHIEDARNGEENHVADALLAVWPAAPRYFTIHFTSPGATMTTNLCGTLVEEEIKVSDASASTIVDLQLPTDGLLEVTQAPPAAGQPEPAPPTVLVKLKSGSLKMTDTNGIRAGLQPDEVQFNFATIADEARVTLQPPGPGVGGLSAHDYSKRLAKTCVNLGRSPNTTQAVKRTLEAYAATIRPPAWTADDEIFHGTRKPWTTLRESDYRAAFDALQAMAAAGTDPTLIRPAEAVLLWQFEGKVAAQPSLLDPSLAAQDFYTSGGVSGLISAGDFLTALAGPLPPYTLSALRAATESQIRPLVRSGMLWFHWGLDKLTNSVFNAAAQDNVLVFTGDVGSDAHSHDTAFNDGLQRISARGVSPPTAGMINDAIRLTQNADHDWFFQTKDSFALRHVWLQHAEYLRRTLEAVFPIEARSYSAFAYIMFNSRIPDRAANLWNDSQNILHNAHAPWIKTPEDALRSFTLTVDEQDRTPRGHPGVTGAPDRSKAIRVLGIHFAALVHSFGGVIPHVLFP